DLRNVLLKPRPAGAPLAAEIVTALWDDLAANDAERAWKAVWALAAAPDQAVPLLRERLVPVRATDGQRITETIAALDSEKFPIREKAMQQLSQMGRTAERALRKVLLDPPSLEVRRRVERLLAKLDQGRQGGPTPQQARLLRALEVLERIGS